MISLLSSEFELIQNEKIRDFTVDAVAERYEYDEHFAEYIKKVVGFLTTLAQAIDADDMVKDIIIASGLLHGVGDTILDARIKLQPLMPKIGREHFNSILYLIERQEGFGTIYPEYQPSLESPIHVWLLPLAIALARK